jgi:uncharacterized membrane protein YoaK (UPF0700 family)
MNKETPVQRKSSLVPVLLLLTATTGIVDAVSYLGLGHVLVANMTGNVVFLGFALVGAKGFSIASFLVALAAFLIGALGGGRLGTTLGADRRRWLAVAAAAQTALAAAAAIAIGTGTLSTTGRGRFCVIALLGIGMGIQNATVRRLAVPDLTTTVLTMTLTGLAADSALAGGGNPRPGRRAASVVAMLAGGAAGAALTLHTSAATSLGVVTAALAVATAVLTSTESQRRRFAPNKTNAQHNEKEINHV